MSALAYFPVVETEDQLIDLLSRAAWFLTFCPLDRIYVPVESMHLQHVPWQIASGMDGAIATKFDILRRKMVFVVVQSERDLDACMREASIILRWKKDVVPNFVSAATLAAWLKGKKVCDVDPVLVRQEGSNYIDVSMVLLSRNPRLLEDNKVKFRELVRKLGRFERAYLMATGPSIADYKAFSYTNVVSIVCNSVILDEELMDAVRPQILVFGDPIFHFGPSQYAASFRNKLLESAPRHNYTICIPNKYYALFISAMPELGDRTIGIPFVKDRTFNFDLSQDFTLKTTANILTFVMVPLATTFADEICFLGCDGRPLQEDNYFWKHNPNTQFNDKMANIRGVHPGFFNIDYNDYYLDHCKTLEEQLLEGEQLGRKFVCLGFSYIPALSARIGRACLSPPLLADKKLGQEYPRLLVVDLTNMGGPAATSRIKDSFFGGWPEEKFRIVCVAGGARKHLVFCTKNGEVVASETGKDELMKAVVEYRSEVLYYRAVDDRLLHEFAARLTTSQVPPFVVHMMDDWPARLCRNKPEEFSYFDKTLRSMFHSASARLSIGQKMSDAFRERYTLAFKPFANAIDPACFPPRATQHDPSQPFVIRYAGALAEDMTFDSVSDVAEAIEALSMQISIRLEIYTRPPWKAPAQQRFAGMKSVSVLEQVSAQEYNLLLQGADALLLAYNFDDTSQSYIGYSMANKLPEYLASGTPVIAYGPADSATIAYVRELGCAEVIEQRSPQILREKIRSLAISTDRQAQLGKAGRDVAFSRHNVWKVGAELHQLLIDIAKSPQAPLVGPHDRSMSARCDETTCVAELFSNVLTGSTMVDVGAHHGSALVHFLNKGWKIIAFEPDESNCQKLRARLSKHQDASLVKLDTRAVSNKSKKSVPFYSSDVSTGISGLSAFHPSHRKTQKVETITLREALSSDDPSSIDFLKIDTEGHDLFVLQGFPWERFKPAVIECEFEDSKTVLLGYSFQDLAGFLVDKGFTVYVSEWHPIIRYGIRHDWNRLVRYPCKLSDSKAWGNLLAFRDGINETKLVEAVRKVLSVGATAQMPAAAQSAIKKSEPARTGAAKLEVALPSRASAPSSATMSVTTPPTPAEPVPPPALTQRVVMQMHDAAVGEGWHEPESHEWGQFRWTGPGERATLNIPVKRDREILLVAAYHTAVNPEQLSELRVEADGAAVQHSIHANLNPKCVVARLPACAKQPGESTELAFVVRTVSPESQPGGNSDKRLLGLAVFWVALIPAEPALPLRFSVSRFESLRRRMDRSRRDAASADFPLSHFDGLAYMEAYPDVADAVLAGSIPSALEHYLRHGCQEGRRFALAVSRAPSAGGIADLFEGLDYLDAYPDVAEAVRRQEIPSAFYHYMEYGRNEGRTLKRAAHGKARRGTFYELLAHQFQIELGRRTEAVKQELEKQFAARQAPFRNQLLGLEKAVGASVRSDQLETLRKEVQQGLSVAARSEDVARLSQQAESLRVSLTEVQQGLSLAARSDDVVRLRHEAEALQAGLAQVQQGLSAAARREDLARLERDATQNLERIQIAAVVAAREAHKEMFGLQMNSLKAGIDSARARAELAEVKVTSVERELGAESRQISESLSVLGNRLESAKADTEKLQTEVAAVKTQSAGDHIRITDPNLNAFNTLHYQAFPRTLSIVNAERLSKHWAPLLGIEIQQKELYYLAHRICSIENLCQGRLAASIQDVLLRILVARGAKTKNLKILEIGTLFGIGIIAMHEALAPLFEGIHFTAMDPLEGYYGADNRDILTGVPVTHAVFEENLRRAGVARERVDLVELLSTDVRASSRLGQKLYDLLVIDADHTYAGVKNDATKFIRRVRASGHVIFDDYGNAHWPDVKKYVDAEIVSRKDLKFVGAEWNTAVFQVRSDARKVYTRTK